MKLRSTAGCEKPACPVVWEGAGAQSPASDPIKTSIAARAERPIASKAASA
jgi:hypothetical protein